MNSHTLRILFLFVSLLCIGAGHRAMAASLSGDEIVKKADDARAPQGDFSCLVKVADNDGSGGINDTTYKVYSKGSDLTLVETEAPARLKGRKLLMRGNDLWLYLPSVRRPTRVGFQQRLTGEVSNGDIARTNFAKDYDAKILGTEKVEGKDCTKLSLTAKRKDVTYNSITYWVEKGNNHPIKAEFYALSGKLLKTGVYSGFAPVLGSERVTKLTITDALRPSKQSTLEYHSYRREHLNDSMFNKETLAE